VLKSTNDNNPISLSGAAEVFITPAAEDISKSAADIIDSTTAGRNMLTAATVAAQVALLAPSIATSTGPVVLVDVASTGYNIDKTGATDVSSSLQTAVTAICAAGKVPYLPDGVYLMGSATLTIPSYGRVVLSRNAILRRTAEPSTPAPMVSMSAFSTFEGGILDHSGVSTSTTSNTIGSSGSKTWTVQSGLGYVAGQVIFVWNAANKWMLGTVSSYSGMSLTLTITSSNGSGTYTSWKFTVASANNAAIQAYNVAQATIRDVAVSSSESKWYIGVCLDTVTKAKVLYSSVAGAINRSFYVYQGCSDVSIAFCDSTGGSVGLYGFNVNPANSTASRIKIDNCVANGHSSQGFELGDSTYYSVIANCTAQSIANTGFLIQVANTAGFPQYNSIVGCTATACTINGFMLAGCFYNQITACEAVTCGVGLLLGSGQLSGGTTYYAQLNTITGFRADACTGNGIQFVASTSRNSCTGVSCVGNAGTGILFDASSTINRVSGNSYLNTTANMTDNGTSNVKDVTTS
jgi:hypothetical protein